MLHLYLNNLKNYALYCRIVADNLDYSVKTRIQTSKHQNMSIHWTHQFAVLDRVTPQRNGSTVNTDVQKKAGQKKISELELSALLPTPEVNKALENDFIILVSRVLTKYLKAFKMFKDVVVHHIPHEHSNEMAEKSDVVNIVFVSC